MVGFPFNLLLAGDLRTAQFSSLFKKSGSLHFSVAIPKETQRQWAVCQLGSF